MKEEISVNGKVIKRPSYFPKIGSRNDSKSLIEVERSDKGIHRSEGLVIDLNKAANLLVGDLQGFVESRFLRIFDYDISENKILIIDPRLDLFFRKDNVNVIRSFIESFRKIPGIIDESLAEISRTIPEMSKDYNRIDNTSRRENRDKTPEEIQRLDDLKKILHKNTNIFKLRMDNVLKSKNALERIIKYQERVKSDFIVPPYFPQEGFDDRTNLDLTLDSYQLAQKIGENILFTFCVKPSYSDSPEKIDEICSIKIPRMFDQIEKRIGSIPSYVGIRFLGFNTRPYKLKYFMAVISECRKNDVEYIHLFDGGMMPKSTDYLGLYFTKHGINSYSNPVATTSDVGGRSMAIVEGQYSYIEEMKLLSYDQFMDNVVDSGQVSCDCEKCRSLRITETTDENEVEGLETFFYDFRNKAGNRNEASKNRKYHFLYQILKFQGLSRNNPEKYRRLFDDYSSQIDMFLIEQN